MKTLKLLLLIMCFGLLVKGQGTPPYATEKHLATPYPAGGGSFPMSDDSTHRGGFRSCKDTIERNAITTDRKKFDMWVECRWEGTDHSGLATKKVYRWNSVVLT